SFGFIDAGGVNRFFFSRNNLRVKDSLDHYIDKNLSEDILIEVSFNIGSNDKGNFAQDIGVVNVTDLN
ncbi:tetratricopeptide repeat protein, partial [Acinetobacter baumannii]|nr:hypothetical protein [Acinetobacter baumannii]